APTTPPPADPGAAPSPARPCALGLPQPAPGGGLADLIAIIPLFGPFSAEAFAMLPAFEPAFPLFGPLFPLAGDALAGAAPLLGLAIPVAQQLEQAGFDTLAPLYGPQRQAFLAAEAQLAAALAPGAEALTTLPGAECVVALEGIIAAAFSTP
ncbi:MAG: hypothetical protein ACRD0U_11255, partial [Acidimicrobiales bacterium]